MRWWGLRQSTYSPISGPGHFNDPDMIICGDFSLSPDECQAQLTLWSIWSAPLYLSNDLRNIQSIYRELILNREVIAIDQDPMGFSGTMIVNNNNVSSVWKKPLAN